MVERPSRAPKGVRLELCITSPGDAVTAERAGADRLELNAALLLGGLTPSLGTLIEVRRATTLPVLAMIRPRPGGFLYGDADLAVMARDIELAVAHGADGVVFGVLKADGTVDRERCRSLADRAGGKEVVFHRAFDVTPDPTLALEELIDLGFRRVMTSGRQSSAYEGASLIADLVRQARGRIEVLPAGGINRFTLADVVRRTGCDQVHASLRSGRPDPSTAANSRIFFGGAIRPPEDRYDATDPDAVGELRALLDDCR